MSSVTKPEIESDLLPAYYREATGSFMKRAQLRDPEYRHRWVKISPHNQLIKSWKGWRPVEDAKELERLGLGDLLHTATGRARYMDTELWRMPRRVADAVRSHIARTTYERKGAAASELAALAQDTRGRSNNTVQPFSSIKTEGAPAPRKGE